jgi:Coenzyme PQQ synthesis protein D (PqqD)
MSTGPAPVVTETDRWERSAEVLWRRTASGLVVLPNDGGTASSLEGLQAALWEALGRPTGLDALTTQLTEHLDDDPAVARRTVVEAVRFLVALGAVRESIDR